MTRPVRDRTPPEVGSVWRERRRQYAKRTVVVVEVDPGLGGFVHIRTLTNTDGSDATPQPPFKPRKPYRVRQSLWHGSWEPTGD